MSQILMSATLGNHNMLYQVPGSKLPGALIDIFGEKVFTNC